MATKSFSNLNLLHPTFLLAFLPAYLPNKQPKSFLLPLPLILTASIFLTIFYMIKEKNPRALDASNINNLSIISTVF